MHKTREQRQQEAIERDLAHDNRTTDEQLALIRQRPGASAKEKARLTMSEKEYPMPKEVRAVTMPHFTEEEKAKIAAFFTDLAEGKTCPHCHAPITELYQVGRCVYNRGCHCRQYQGVVPKEKRTQADQEQIDEASMWSPLEPEDEEDSEP